MKESIILTIIFSIISLSGYSQKEINSQKYLDSLSLLMEKKESYVAKKDSQLTALKNQLNTPKLTNKQRYEINNLLYNEYKTFISDSAIFYAKENMKIANSEKDVFQINQTKLDMASLYVVAGMYVEALNLLKSIDKAELKDKSLLVNYYNAYKQWYGFYSQNNAYTSEYLKTSNLYRDSLLTILDKNSNHYKIVYAEKLYDENDFQKSKEMLQAMFDATKSDTHEKAVLAYALANIYGKEKNVEMQKLYYIKSAICDIKNAIKENASMQRLSLVLYEQGDLEMAYKCIRSSLEDAMFCNARMRTYEVSKIFPIIDSAYREKVSRQKKELQSYLLLAGILSVILLATIFYVYKQMKRIAGIRKELYKTNMQLSDLNSELQGTNNQLLTVNNQLNSVNMILTEANRIKEIYIGNLFDLCSSYIDKLEKFQNTLHKKAVERKLDELYKILKSRDMINDELKELYHNFDTTFLHLYPNFVEEFNALLQEDERFELKPNELLNAELRIFALIRLGISDSSKIASFLHYSANTIYSYRTRVRNKASVPRDDFENQVMKISSYINKA